MLKPPKMTVDGAEAIGLEALGFLAEDSQRLDRFLSLTGIDPSALRSAADAPSTLIAVMDHLLSDESLLLVFAASRGFRPDDIAPARDLIDQAGRKGASR